nr:M56 family metallopeptidase [Algoriphagus sp.]
MEYLLKSILCLLILLLFHRLVLQQEVLYRFNRFFLLSAVVGSFLIPLVTIEVAQEVAFVPVPADVYSEGISSVEPLHEVVEMPALEAENNNTAEVQISWQEIGWAVYLLGVVVFLVRFLRNLRLIYNQVHGNLTVTYRQETLVLIPELASPFSFLRYIFYSKNAFEKAGIPEAVFLHEQCHVRERHTWDVLFIEALLVVFWFHPGLYFARQAVKLNHEFIADQQVIQRLPVSEYQSLLLTILSGQQGFALGSSLNFSLTKKRFEMMNRKVKKPTTWMKMLSVLPILAGLIYLFSEKVPAKSDGEKNRKDSREVEDSPKEKLETHILIKADGQLEVDGQLVKIEDLEGLIESKYTSQDLAVISGESGVEMGQLADVQEALRNQNVRQVVYQNSQTTSHEGGFEPKRERHFRDAIFLIESVDMEYTQKRYAELSEKEKTGLLFTDKKVEKNSPDNELFERWKNEKEFAVWIDGRSVSNKALSNYQAKDFVKWFQSGVKANARSARFPQPFQVHLYSLGYFEESFGPNSDMFRPRTNRDTITITQRKMTSMKDLSRYPDPVTAFLQKNARYEKLKASPNASDLEVREEIQQLFEELEDAYSKTPENRKYRLKKPTPPQTSDSKIVSFEPGLADYVSRYATYQTKINKSGFFSSFSQQE